MTKLLTEKLLPICLHETSQKTRLASILSLPCSEPPYKWPLGSGKKKTQQWIHIQNCLRLGTRWRWNSVLWPFDEWCDALTPPKRRNWTGADTDVGLAPTQFSWCSGFFILFAVVIKIYLLITLYLDPHLYLGYHLIFGLGPPLELNEKKRGGCRKVGRLHRTEKRLAGRKNGGDCCGGRQAGTVGSLHVYICWVEVSRKMLKANGRLPRQILF
jgi:hypothetical protein